MTGEPSDVVVLTSVATEAEAAVIIAALEGGGLRATMTGELTSGLWRLLRAKWRCSFAAQTSV